MLPQHHRLRKSAEFVSVIKGGRRVNRPTLVLYAQPSEVSRCGVIVGKTVGGAVQRNRVKRVLRHGMAQLIDHSNPMDIVVRALPYAANRDIRSDLTTAWEEAVTRLAS